MRQERGKKGDRQTCKIDSQTESKGEMGFYITAVQAVKKSKFNVTPKHNQTHTFNSDTEPIMKCKIEENTWERVMKQLSMTVTSPHSMCSLLL